jgi:hypothetical protein
MTFSRTLRLFFASFAVTSFEPQKTLRKGATRDHFGIPTLFLHEVARVGFDYQPNLLAGF